MSYPNAPGPQPGNGASDPQQWGEPASGPTNPQPYGTPNESGQPMPLYGQMEQPAALGQQAGQPPAYGQPGQPPMAPQNYPQPGVPPVASPYSQYGGFPGTDPNRRPGVLLASCIMAWIGSAFLALFGLLFLFASGNSDFLDGAGIPAEATSIFQIAGGIAFVYAVAVIVLAVFAFKRSKGAWIALIVLGILYALLMIFAVVGGTPQSLIPFLWTAVAVGLLFPAGKWYAQR